MSYILDALRKAEQKRKLEHIPELESAVVRDAPGRRAVPWGWLAALLAILLLAAAAILFREPLLAKVHDWLQGSGDAPAEMAGEPAEVTSRPAPKTSAPRPATETPKPAAPVKKAPPRREPAAPPPSPPVSGQSGKALTPAQQQRLDAVDLTVISYSTDPQKRFIMVGAEILREGDEIPGGIVIAQIRRGGVVVEIDGREAMLKP